jgi:hypothetical protein
MKFKRSGGLWIFGWSVVYFIVGMLNIFVFKEQDWFPLTQIVWLCIIALPLVCNPLARWLNMKENHMFDWLKGKDKMPDNVVPFPEPKETPKMPYVVPPAPKPEPKIYYTFGLTDDNRVTFQMGYTTLTMKRAGVQQLIEQLEFFRDQLHDEDSN